ncbi:methyltransferase domain-containing protein [Temperatibacter marinus]|uniref:Methyltransferase domain-containing protein n=1 Tax=Temperatibacter marinus TaxID=1456591 RepID=A0AA52EID4_9PROT|nr:methyltransferase domain-containing protein [Temperatibacter marinus]WND03723.1 methyltransferase domain-containing protein [Temperatibacter marinus]
MAGKKGNKKLPLTLRLKSWWEGYDSEEVEKRYVEALPEEVPETAPEPEEDKNKPKETQSGLAVDPWDEKSIDIAQYIWGEGYCGPGGPEYIVSLSKLLALSPEMSMIQLGADIGGPARTLCDRFGVWITGYERDENLVNAGNELSKMQGLGKKAELEYYEPESEEFKGFDRKFDRAMAKEALCFLQNKEEVIHAVSEKLKPGGLFLITDYVLGHDAATAKDNYKNWKVGERDNPYPVMAEDLTELLKKANLQVRVSEDISIQYVEMINQAWRGADKIATQLAQQEDGAQMIQILMREAEYWTRRKKLLEHGDLKLWRIVANQKSGGPSMMSDW